MHRSVVFACLVSVVLSLNCWSDTADGKSHSSDKRSIDCGDCKYCAKGTAKLTKEFDGVKKGSVESAWG
ncbi:unnamed protein product, partial [Mesorhabditis belari]|uniref:Uncharacterized protein n=1 Tax=Mesorhabditis belari TaxID=2138241 RepID=A0AAF3FBG6_9BILA